jgi:hypothetical protein
MRRSLIAIGGIVCIALAGCGDGGKADARSEMEVSRAAYQFCLAQHPDAPETCDSAKASFQSGVKAYRDNSVGALSR